jgi:meiotically up-regulated gene 157 (Mug157) protein
VKSEIEKALAEAKTAVESGDSDEMQQKTAALTQAAMKLGEAMYKAQQAETEAAAGPDAGTGFMHEAFDADDPAQFSRPWFAWANSLFGELMLNVARKRPRAFDLLA